ncbi:glutamate receptor 2-like [Oculina patagonica]
MERRSMYIGFIIVISLIEKVVTTNRTFTCGFVNGYSAEYDVVNSVFNNAPSFDNVSVVLKEFNISDNTNLFTTASALLDQNVIALVEGSNTNSSACALSEVTGIPLIRLHGDARHFECEKAIQMSAGYKDYTQASLALLNTFGWTRITLVYDEHRLHEAGDFHAISRSSELIVNLVQLSEQANYEDSSAPILRAMDQIKDFETEVILLYMEKENIELMLQQKPCKYRETYKWILQGEIPLKLSCYQNIVVALKLPYIENNATEELENSVGSNYSKTNKELLALAHDSVQVINQAVNKNPCLSINGSAISSVDTDAMLACLRKVYLDGITGTINFNEHGKRKGVDLEILNLRNNSYKKIGTWNSTKGAVLFDSVRRNMDNPESKGSIEGRKFRAVVQMDAPFVMRKEQEDGSFVYEGYCIDLLNELARNLKFTYELYPSPDGMYGAETENGTWNGMVGELVAERADIIVAPLTVTESREKVIDFSVPFMFYTEEMLLKKHSAEESNDLLQFMNPFANEVWFATLGTLVVMSISVFLINYYSPYGYKDETGKGTSEEFSFFNSVWFAVACMLQQGGDNTPKSLSGRILAGCYWFCILIWVSTYTANLAAFFTVSNVEHPINNLEDIVKSTYKVAVLDSSSTSEFFKTSQYETHKKIWRRIETDNTLANSVAEGVEWVREREEYVFITDGPLLRLIANQPPCDVTVVSGLSTAKGLSFALQTNDPHTNDFKLGILRLNENNFLSSLERKWWENANQCPEEEDTSLSRKRIGLMAMLGVYIVLGVGMFISFVTLCVELYWKKRAKQILMNKIRKQRTKLRAFNIGRGVAAIRPVAEKKPDLETTAATLFGKPEPTTTTTTTTIAGPLFRWPKPTTSKTNVFGNPE